MGIKKVYGIDLDDERRKVSESRGIKTYNLDIENDSLPFDDNSVDLVTSFGVLEHLKFYDKPISEANRILKKSGWAVFSIPNLGSWINRLSLLFGYQPRDVEISSKKSFGIFPLYPDNSFLYHIHSATYKAFKEILEYYGFEIVSTRGFAPYSAIIHNKFLLAFLKVFDKMSLLIPSLSRRIIFLCKKIY